MLLYNKLRSVIPATAGIQVEKTGFRIKSGMTKRIKPFLKHYTRCSYTTNYVLFPAVRHLNYMFFMWPVIY